MRQFLRFVTVGMTNTAVTLGAYSVALRLALPYLPAGALAYGLGAANGFVLNRAWTFRVRGRPPPAGATPKNLPGAPGPPSPWRESWRARP